MSNTSESLLPRDAGTSLLLLDVDVPHLDQCLAAALDELDKAGALDDPARREAVEHALSRHAELGPDAVKNGVAILHDTLDQPGLRVQVLVRLKQELPDGRGADDVPLRHVWILLSDAQTHPHMSVAAEMAELMEEPGFREAFELAPTREALEQLYAKELADEVGFAHHIPPELQRTGRFAGGLIEDIKRRLPHYASDFTDGLNSKSIASVFFLFFACLAPAVAFGGLLSVLTGGTIGAIEMIVATAVCGTVYALISGQPLTILGSTGPVIIFMGILYALCQTLGIPYLPTLACVGLWTTVFLLILAFTDACSLIRYFTRFTDDTFAALISLIFIFEAIKDMTAGFMPVEEGQTPIPYDTALLSLLLAVGTFWIGSTLSRMRASAYLRRPVREFLADFGPSIAIAIMTGVAFWLHPVELELLAVPEEFATTSGRGWLVNPLDAPSWVWAASAIPAVLVSILLYLDQNITVRLVNNPEFQLKKGSGYNLDLAVVGGLVGVCSMFGLPWMVAATVRSLNHVRSLNVIEQKDGRETITGTVETRVTGLLVHLLVGGSLLFLGLLRQVPMSVLFGLFLFMGVASMRGNQLFERMQLWFMDPKLYPPSFYLRAVPKPVVHKYTAIQAACLGILWVVKTSAIGILFPLFIGLLVPVRMLLKRFFKPAHLALLDAHEAPSDEEFRDLD